MRARLLTVVALQALAACGGATGVIGAGGGESSTSSTAGTGAGRSSGGGGSSSLGSSSLGSSSLGSSSGGASSGGASSGSSGSSSSAASSSVGSACPASAPVAFTACAPVGIECEYGDSPSYMCTVHVTCESDGWVYDDRASTCVAGTCPSTYASVPQGQACSPDGLDCAYAEGECNCLTRGLPAPSVGSIWQCFSPDQCPEPRPRIGSACSRPDQECDYGACAGGVALQCTNGYWQQAVVACPL